MRGITYRKSYQRAVNRPNIPALAADRTILAVVAAALGRAEDDAQNTGRAKKTSKITETSRQTRLTRPASMRDGVRPERGQ